MTGGRVLRGMPMTVRLPVNDRERRRDRILTHHGGDGNRADAVCYAAAAAFVGRW